MDLVVEHHPLNCCMLENVLSLFLAVGSDAVHEYIYICHVAEVSYCLYMFVLGFARRVGAPLEQHGLKTMSKM